MFVFDKNFQNPRTYSGTVSYERELVANLSAFATFTHSKTVHVTRFINRNDRGVRVAVEHGPRRRRHERHRHADGGRELRQGASTTALTVGMNKRYAQQLPVPGELHARRATCRTTTTSATRSRFRYARADNLAPEYNYSDRDQRHRFNAWLLVTAGGLRLQHPRLGALGAAASRSATRRRTASSRTARIIKRNTLRKDNEFFTWDLRVSRPFKLRAASVDRADLRDLQPDQQQEHPPARGDEPDLQLRRHRAERPRRSAAGAARGQGEVLRTDRSIGSDQV